MHFIFFLNVGCLSYISDLIVFSSFIYQHYAIASLFVLCCVLLFSCCRFLILFLVVVFFIDENVGFHVFYCNTYCHAGTFITWYSMWAKVPCGRRYFELWLITFCLCQLVCIVVSLELIILFTLLHSFSIFQRKYQKLISHSRCCCSLIMNFDVNLRWKSYHL